MFHHVADTENKNQEVFGLSCYNIVRLCRHGLCGLPKDPEVAKRYCENAKKASPDFRE